MNKDRCPCGGIILADTEDWETPLCYSCFYELSVTTKDFQKLKSQNAELIAALEKYEACLDFDEQYSARAVLRKIKGESE